jgi:hypothetical protein
MSENWPLLAQSIWLDRSQTKTIDLEILKPDFEGEHNTTFPTSSWYLSGRFPLSVQVNITGEIVFSYYKLDAENNYSAENEGQNAFGNPYIGIELYSENRTIFGEIGLRLPFTPEENASAVLYSGIFTDFVERAEAFMSDILPVYVLLNYMKVEESGFQFRVHGGPVAWFATGDREDTEWCLLYSMQGGYHSATVNFWAGLSGRWIMSAEDATFAESSYHQFGLSANLLLGTFKPGIILKFPLDDDMKEVIDLVFGLTLGFNLD